MACGGCSKTKSSTQTGGCGSNCGCSTGGCNKMNTFNWLSDFVLPDSFGKYDIYEISFKNGNRKGFYRLQKSIDIVTGDLVSVSTRTGGFDVGRVSLSGELVKMQMKKKKVKEDSDAVLEIFRLSTDSDLKSLNEARLLEYETMIQARTIARHLKLDMKIGDVEYQGDKRKATFYYIADDRVDFRELIKEYARVFKIKIEMRQIGSRQESARIGGIGSCGRELCCSTWLSDFKSVNTVTARYQNLSINQTKLSGQCGRLKCCLNFEIDIYLDELKAFPKNADVLKLERGLARSIKTNVFKKEITYKADGDSKFYVLSIEKVNEIVQLNKNGKFPLSLSDFALKAENASSEEDNVDLESVDAVLDLKTLDKKEKEKRNQQRNASNKKGNSPQNTSTFNRSNTNPNAQKPALQKQVVQQIKPSEDSKKLNRPITNKPASDKPSASSPSITKPGFNKKDNKPNAQNTDEK